jgi:NAD(P)-dependent dehydrogenase (short-subunit alcohol dehydrogenase family)
VVSAPHSPPPWPSKERSSLSAAAKARGRTVLERVASTGAAEAAFVAADLGKGASEVRRLAEEATAAAGGRIDVLVNNAAMLLMPAPTAEVTEQLVADAFAVNVTAPFLLTGIIAPRMAKRGSGSIVNIGSINGLIGMAGSALYSATKATIHSLTKSWADEYGPCGVRVNTVAPGPSLTRTQRRNRHAPGAAAGPDSVTAGQHALRSRCRGGISGQRRRQRHQRRNAVSGRRLVGGLDIPGP